VIPASPRTILFVHSSDELYGADRVLLEIVRGLPGRYRAVVALPRDVAYRGELSAALRAAGAEVHYVDMAILRRAYLRPAQLPGLLRRVVTGSLTLARLARAERAALVHSNTIAAICGPLAAVITRRPHLWDVHENLADEPAPLALALRTALSLVPGGILANSRSSARSIVHGSRRRWKRTRVVYYGVEEEEPNRAARTVAPTALGNPLPIAFMGRLTSRKGIDQALDAVALLHSEGRCLRFDVYGSAPPTQGGDTDRHARRARVLGISDIVHFHGFTPDARYRLEPGGILLVPSQRPEPFGLVLVEGMLARQVVVACRNGGGSDEILEDGVTGLYCGLDPASIAQAVAQVADDPHSRREIGDAAAAAARERFSMSRFHSTMLTIYDQMVDSSRS